MSLLVASVVTWLVFFKVGVIVVQSNDVFVSSPKQRETIASSVEVFNAA